MKKKKFTWRKRYYLVVVMFLVGIILMFDRAVISGALPFMAKDLNLDSVATGAVISAFSLSYALMQIPGGLLVDKLGSRIMGTVAILFWSVFTFLTGSVMSFAALIAIRFTFGLGEGSYVPAQYKAIAVWFPKKERGRATSISNIGMSVGGALTSIIAATLIVAFGWRNVFYILLIPGLIIAALFWFVVKSSPAKNKKISAEEMAEINSDDVSLETAEKVRIRDILKYPAVWQIYITYFMSAMVSFGVNSWLAVYVVDGLHGTIMQFGVAGMIASIGSVLGTFAGGFAADKLRSLQKIQMCVCWILSSLFLYMGVASNSFNNLVIFFTLQGFFFASAAAALLARMAQALPRKAMGIGAGIIQTSGYIAGAISPLLIGFIVKATGGSYQTAFTVMCAFTVIGGLFALTIKKADFQQKAPASQAPDRKAND